MKTARLLITKDCHRDCPYCCNKYERVMEQIQEIDSLDALEGFGAICITGGEPLLDFDRTFRIVMKLQEKTKAKIYLYTTIYVKGTTLLLSMLDGINFTLHNEVSAKDSLYLRNMQRTLTLYDHVGRPQTNRLLISPDLETYLYIIPAVWNRITVEPWKSEDELMKQNSNNGIPANETMFFLKGE